MRKTLTVGALALLVSGCMLGPDYFRPAVDTPPAWRVNDQEAHTAIDAAWWRQFGDPQLDALVDEALSANLDLLIASERIAEYAGRLGVARADLFPQVGAGYDVARQRNTPPGATSTSIYNSYGAVLSASWEIDLWGRIRRQTEAARAQLVASEEGRRGVLLTAVIVLPLFVPPVIFGGGALDAYAGGLPWRAGFALLAAYAAAAVALGPIAMAAACRNALS